ncbi:hypothetical protein EU538_12765 [Candidatus Thorarchaeota archaeon]|nr:MAG: hypothetical protein EU538_12765 [Candidatus Thorarchaeota archaeon]
MKRGSVRSLTLLFLTWLSLSQMMLFTQPPSGGVAYGAGEIVPGLAAVDPVDNPDLDQAPEFTIAGTSDEFYHSHQVDAGDGFATLNWTHHAGSELNLRSEPHENLPDCYDFVYFSLSFVWSYETLPLSATFGLKYSALRTGHFNSTIGSITFALYAFLIDSSGNWVRVYRSNPPYSGTMLQRTIRLDEEMIAAAFAGMTENEFGLQDDPSDLLTLALVLSPTIAIETYPPPEGSVEFCVTEVGITVVGDYGERIEVITPKNNSTWIHDRETNSALDLVVAPDDSVFLAGVMYQNFTQEVFATLSRWTSSCYVTWNRSWRESDVCYATAVTCDSSSNVYVAGIYTGNSPYYSRVFLTKWTDSGDMSWARMLESSPSHQYYLLDVVCDDAGRSYILYQNSTQTDRETLSGPGIQCWSENGTLLWEQSYFTDFYEPARKLAIDEDHAQYILTGYSLIKTKGTDGIIWQKDGRFYDFSVDSDNSIVVLGYTLETLEAPKMALMEISPEGIVEWTTLIPLLFDGMYVASHFGSAQLSIAHDMSIAVLSISPDPTISLVLDKFNSSGEHEERWLLNTAYLTYSTEIEIGSNGLVYLAFRTLDYSGFHLCAYAFSSSVASTGLNLYQVASISITVVSIGVIAVVGVMWLRHKRASMLPGDTPSQFASAA